MTNPITTWLPTSKKQSGLIYALNALLLCNLTVVVLMLSGELLGEDEPATEPVNQAEAIEAEPMSVVQADADPKPVPANTEDALPIEPLEPVVSAAAATAPAPIEPAHRETTPRTTPEVTEPPVTFFGVPVN